LVLSRPWWWLAFGWGDCDYGGGDGGRAWAMDGDRLKCGGYSLNIWDKS
jgi:hypothetical protein